MIDANFKISNMVALVRIAHTGTMAIVQILVTDVVVAKSTMMVTGKVIKEIEEPGKVRNNLTAIKTDIMDMPSFTNVIETVTLPTRVFPAMSVHTNSTKMVATSRNAI